MITETKKEEKKYQAKWLYHKELGARLIKSLEEEKSLGKGWEDSPAKLEVKKDERK